MVDEYNNSRRIPERHNQGSDSSMVDEYPAWPPFPAILCCRSDSSMVDEYQEGAGTGGRKVRSDSSMVDEYNINFNSLTSFSTVQIPLWSMNT